MGSQCVRAPDAAPPQLQSHPALLHDGSPESAAGSRQCVQEGDSSTVEMKARLARDLRMEFFGESHLRPKSFKGVTWSDELREFDLEHDLDRDHLHKRLAAHMLIPRDANPPSSPERQRNALALITLNIYDVGTSHNTMLFNRITKPMGAGIFHCGVEVYGREWSFSDTESGTGCGVFSCLPRRCDGHSFLESVNMGQTGTPENEVLQLIYLLAKWHWRVEDYCILTFNCCHFCDDFCKRLGVGSIPEWVTSLAGLGAGIVAAHDTTCCRQVAGSCSNQICSGGSCSALVVPPRKMPRIYA